MTRRERTQRLDLVALRLRNQRLIGAPCATPEAVVGWLGAVQAQDYPAAKWAVALRTADAVEADVERASDRGAILRTHVLRPTWHFVLPTDLRWMLALSGPRLKRAMASYQQRLGLDERTFGRSNAALARALAGTQLTRAELTRVLTRARIAAPAPRMLHLLFRAEIDAVICSGARRGKHATYALVDDRCPPMPAFDRDAALAQLATRYFASHGPAVVADFAWWSGLAAADARRAVELARPALTAHTIDDQPYYVAAAEPVARRRAPTVHLLPNFDEYLVAYKHRASVTHDAIPAAVGSSVALLSTPIVVLDGRVIGTWRRVATRAAVTVTTQLVTPLDAPQRRALDLAVARYGRFLGVPAQLARAG
jgi:hypothetical protein